MTNAATLDENLAPYVALRGTVGTQQCAQWREAIFSRHWPLMRPLVKHYRQLAHEQGHVVANTWLRQADERLRFGQTGLYLHSDYPALVDVADAKARAFSRMFHDLKDSLTGDMVLQVIKAKVEEMGLAFPELAEDATGRDKVAALARVVVDDHWLRRQLRTQQWRQMENFNRELGLVSQYKGIYVSDLSFQRRKEQKDRTARLLKRMEATNEDQQTYTLAELNALSVSNPINRRHELMTRLRGFEAFAQQAEEDWQGVLLTVTCPSKFHAIHSVSGQPNEKFNGASPREANDYLNTLWQRTRAAWDRQEIRAFGFRVAEPHHDGTPHWHLLLFIRKHQIQEAEAIFRDYALQEDGNEPGAQEKRFQTLMIDPKQGSAAGYLAKYISKNIDGFGIETDLYGQNAVESAMRIEAWASIHGIRQFQPIGGPSVTVWRELRRLEAQGASQDLLKTLIEAADEGDWATYTTLMGGAVCRREERPLRPYMIEREGLNKYGETLQALKGLVFDAQPIITRVHDWVIQLVNPDTAANDDDLAPALHLAGNCALAPSG